MPRRSDRKSPRQAPLYIRWAPFRSPYAIELRLDLVPHLLAEIERAAAAGLEVGGVLVGSYPNAQTPTLRVEEIELMARRPENGAIYVPHPETNRHLHEIRLRAQRQSRALVGFFRSHARSTPLLPSITDRSLISEQFSQGVFALLIIEARAPHFAAFFLSAGGQLPEEPSTREFVLDEDEFKALPEIRPAGAVDRHQGRRETPNVPFYALLAVGLIALVSLLAWAFQRGIVDLWSGRSSNQLGLTLTATDHVLRISWDHSARSISDARGATILIADGTAHHEVRIGPDELRLGTVDYERTAPRVDVTMTLDNPAANVQPQSATWSQK